MFALLICTDIIRRYNNNYYIKQTLYMYIHMLCAAALNYAHTHTHTHNPVTNAGILNKS